MDIKDIASIELNREELFNHKILIKDNTGYVLEEIPVKENNEWESFMLIYKSWAEHPDFSPEPPTTE